MHSCKSFRTIVLEILAALLLGLAGCGPGGSTWKVGGGNASPAPVEVLR